MSDRSFTQLVLNIHQSGVLTVLFGCDIVGAMWNCCHLGTCSLYTIQPCTSLQCHFIWSHIHMSHVHVRFNCLAVTCHQHFWQNDLDLLHATAVTFGWKRHQNKRQHRMLATGEEISPAACARKQICNFWSRVRHCQWAVTFPFLLKQIYVTVLQEEVFYIYFLSNPLCFDFDNFQLW